MSRIWALQKDEWLLLTLGCIGAIGGGTIQPIFSLVYAGIIATYFMPDDKSIRCPPPPLYLSHTDLVLAAPERRV